jgi:thiol-disulfide isomerase/thioredoxin
LHSRALFHHAKSKHLGWGTKKNIFVNPQYPRKAMTEFSKKIVFALIGVFLYIGLYYIATSFAATPPTLRALLLIALPLVLVAFTAGALIYGVWTAAKQRNTVSLILIIMSLVTAVFLVPIWFIIARQSYYSFQFLRKMPAMQQAPEQKPVTVEPAQPETKEAETKSVPLAPEKEAAVEKSVDVYEHPVKKRGTKKAKATAAGQNSNITSKRELDAFVKKNARTIAVFTSEKDCPACKIAKPIINKAKQKYPHIAYPIIDFSSFANAMDMGIDEVPTLVVYMDGKEIERFTFKGDDKFTAALEKNSKKLLGN